MERRDVVAYLDELFPPNLMEDWDHSGLQVGDLSLPCRRVLVSLDFGLVLVDKLQGVDLLVTHHPLLFRPVREIRPEIPQGRKVAALLREGTACYSVHTPYDAARGGMGERLARILGLRGTEPLAPRGKLYKLAVFVPPEAVEDVAGAVFAAGAGKIGRYGRCSFRTEGTGTFLPEEGTRPYIGKAGEEEHVREIRLETIVPAEKLHKVIEAMLSAHPYEEVAYDVYPLEIKDRRHGLGRVGTLPEPARAGEVIDEFAEAIGARNPIVYGDTEHPVERVAVCGGAGGSLWQDALASGAQLFLTGEVGYHEGLAAAEAGLTVAALGHRETEALFVDHVAELIERRFPELEVIKA
ncbi:Nif3-like dinuclear metal center hexameric protein [Candidatus Bipolaricaulota sp. J31]